MAAGLELFMSRMVGTVSRGVRAPIIRSGDDLVEIVTKSVLEAAAQPEDGFAIPGSGRSGYDRGHRGRAQGNYASVDDIAADVKEKLGGETVGVIFPILSRNRFAVCLRGIAKGAKKIVLMLSYPSDEVGNHLIDPDVMDEKGVDPYRDVLTGKIPGAVRLHRAPLHWRGLCGLLHGPDPGLRRGDGGHLRQ